MDHIRTRPLVVPACSFALGIIVATEYEPSYLAVVVYIAISLIVLMYAYSRGLKPVSLYVAPLFLLLGALYTLPYLTYDSATVSRYATTERVRIEGTLYKYVEERAGSVRLWVKARNVYDEGESPTAIDGKVLVTVRDRKGSGDKDNGAKYDRLLDAHIGDTVLMYARLRLPMKAMNPGSFDYEDWLKRRGIAATATLDQGSIYVLDEERGGLRRLFEDVRHTVRGAVDKSEATHAGVMKALLIGARGAVPDKTAELFKRAGIAHLLAISGLHMGLVAMIFAFIAFYVFTRSERLILMVNVRRLSVIVAIVPVIIYGLVAGFPISAVRAVLMISVLVLALALNRVKDAYNTLAVAFLAVLIASPMSLWDVSFQLSFVSVFFIIYLGSTVIMRLKAEAEVEGLRRVRRSGGIFSRGKLKLLFFVSASATLATMPIIALNFHRISPASFISNILVVPLTGILTVPLLLAGAVVSFSDTLSGFFFGMADISISLIVMISELVVRLPLASLWVTTPTVAEVILYYLALLLVPMLFTTGRRRAFSIVFIAVMCISLISIRGYGYYKVNYSDTLRVTFLSVGQGDSILIEFPSGSEGRVRRMLIDGGGSYSETFDVGEQLIAPYLWKRRITKVDKVILTHPELDHMGGLPFIVDNFAPNEFYWSGEGELSTELKVALEKSRVKVIVAKKETEPIIYNGVTLGFLNTPWDPLAGTRAPSMNNTSVIAHMCNISETCFLFTGDAEREAEALLLKEDIRSRVLKVGHHGSSTSTTKEFLDSVYPEYAVISLSGTNRFGFPHASVLRSLDELSVKVLRTDKDGAITFFVRGDEVRLSTYLTRE